MYERLGFEELYRNPWVIVQAHTIVHPNGVPGEHVLVEVPPAAGVVVLDGDDVLLARQARFAAQRDMLEIVKGGAAPGESELAAAQRETREELGVIAGRWDALGTAWEIPSIVSGSVSLFLARDIDHVVQDQEAVEAIAIARLPFAQALQRALRGGLDDAVTVTGLVRAAALLGRL